MRKQGFYVCLYFYLMFPANIIGLWWAVGSPLVMEPNKICRKNRKLSGKQRQICRREKEIVDEVVNGAKLAIAECQYQFQYRRWNCTTARKSFSRILRRDTRETAFVYAITAAGAVFTVGKACAWGNLKRCKCDEHKEEWSSEQSWLWRGCNDGVNFGYLKSKEFMDTQGKTPVDMSTKIRLHNNEAGRLAIREHMRLQCICHGWATACSIKTCWKRMPSFRDVGLRLKEKFDKASKVALSDDGKLTVTWGDDMKRPSKEELVYAERSPTFCDPRKKYGSLGTHGRICNPEAMGISDCTLMCCGRGFNTTQLTVQEECHCQFIYCCEIQCETCTSTRNISRCL
ncbi:protein Wnt-6-like isoform X2 [Mercenaria mercenaria]|uniref:protein Wnt-6-like isoform X2 n=1 Tax=Mercenaria mercenaria TaxID=6596 RepID=UPI00234F9C90|nr:protein Wnt-6-like isoform X2 [Mercenaria mercenaria]